MTIDNEYISRITNHMNLLDIVNHMSNVEIMLTNAFYGYTYCICIIVDLMYL